MLQQIGQDMTMTEQQLRVHNMQTRKTVQLKRVSIYKNTDDTSYKFNICIYMRRYCPSISWHTSATFTKR
jgi:hypothetical protein